MNAPLYSHKIEKELADFAAIWRNDPYGFVMAMFPWGQPLLPDGSVNPLREKHGPEPWQERLLKKIGEHVRANNDRISVGLWPKVWRSARSSGHGVGKSALVAWLILWVMCTRFNTRGVVTANTQGQLETKTWPELAKWHSLLLVKHWFKWTATSYSYALAQDEESRKRYMVNAITVAEENPEAFQGLHNEDGAILIIFDEASGVPAKIWEVADGATTDGEVFFLVFGNPTQPDGPFADCFDRLADMYDTEFVDSRDVSHTNKEAIKDILRKYGEDSDEARVRVYGRFPRQAYNGFISLDVVQEAVRRPFVYDPGAALIMSVDVARFGDDETVIGWRQGRDFRTRPLMTFKGLSIVKVAEIVMREADRTQPDAIVIEGTGLGAGVIDICRSRNYKVVEVSPGAHSSHPEHHWRKREEIWHAMRDWLIDQGCLMDDPVLTRQLTSIQYELDRFEQRVKLETKDDMKKRTGLFSPDRADTLALTFGVKIARRDANLNFKTRRQEQAVTPDYDPIRYHMEGA